MSNEEEQTAQRRAKLDELTQLGVTAYPTQFDRRATISQIVQARREQSAETLEQDRPETRVAGRILSIRGFGKANFLVLSDGLERIQVYIRADALSARDFQIFKLLDFGDHIGVEGRIFR